MVRPRHLNLGELIEALEKQPSDKIARPGFDDPHSYRGYYEQLAFCIVPSASVGEMLKSAKRALGATFEGWKGGDFTMSHYTECWLVEDHGDTGESIGAVLLSLMLGADTEGEHPGRQTSGSFGPEGRLEDGAAKHQSGRDKAGGSGRTTTAG